MQVLLWLSLSQVIESSAYAGLYLNLALLPASDSLNHDQISEKTTPLRARVGAGFYLMPYLFLGGGYIYARDSRQATGSIAETETTAAASAGVGIGASEGSGLWVMACALFYPTSTWSGSSSITYYGGSGTSVDLGYSFRSGSFTFGPQISLVSMNFKKESTEAGSEDLEDDRSRTGVQPYFVFGFIF
ncbi:MAG: hypothetical protein HQK54_18465 [Oligoflexales bacterium]|nr:hypothetical protein [Oligoflexales bacterium]